MSQLLATVDAFGGTASDQDAYYDNIKMEPGFFDDFSTDTTGTYNLFYTSLINSTFTYDPARQRASVHTGP